MQPSPNGERSPLLFSQDPSSHLASVLNYGSSTPYRSENQGQLLGREDLQPSPPTHIQDIEEVRRERQALETICTKTSSKLIDVSPHVPLQQNQTADSRPSPSSRSQPPTDGATPPASAKQDLEYTHDPSDLQHSPPDSPSTTIGPLTPKPTDAASPPQALPPHYDFLRLFRETFQPPPRAHANPHHLKGQELPNGTHDTDEGDCSSDKSRTSTLREKEREWLRSIIERDGESRRWDPDQVRGTNTATIESDSGGQKLLFWF